MTDAPLSFRDVLKQSQDLISKIETLQEDVSVQLTEKKEKLMELARTHSQLQQLQRQLDDLQTAQVQWAVERQAFVDEHEQLRKAHEELTAAHVRTGSELAGALDNASQLRKAYADLKQAHAAAGLASERSLKAAAADVNRLQQELHLAKDQVYQVEQERIQLTQKAEVTQADLRDQLAAVSADLRSLQVAERQWGVDREAMGQERQAALTRQAQLEREWMGVQARVTQENDKLQEQLATLQQQLQVAGDEWQGERERLLADVTRLEQEAKSFEAALLEERKGRQGDQEEGRRQREELEKVQKERERLREERAALQVKLQDAEVREASYDAEQAKLRDQLASVSAELGTLRVSQRQGMAEREALQQERQAAVGRQIQLEQEWQSGHARWAQEKTELQTQLTEAQHQLQIARAELLPLQASSHEWQSERERLLVDRARLQQEAQAREAAFKAERKLRQTHLEEARTQLGEMEEVREERDRLRRKQTTLLGQVEALQRDVQARAALSAVEQAKLRGQLAALSGELDALRSAPLDGAEKETMALEPSAGTAPAEQSAPETGGPPGWQERSGEKRTRVNGRSAAAGRRGGTGAPSDIVRTRG